MSTLQTMPKTPWWAFRCRRRGHDWFPGEGRREFIPTSDICFRCSVERVLLPWGLCVTGHPIAEHYDETGNLTPHPTCPGPS